MKKTTKLGRSEVFVVALGPIGFICLCAGLAFIFAGIILAALDSFTLRLHVVLLIVLGALVSSGGLIAARTIRENERKKREQEALDAADALADALAEAEAAQEEGYESEEGEEGEPVAAAAGEAE